MVVGRRRGAAGRPRDANEFAAIIVVVCKITGRRSPPRRRRSAAGRPRDANELAAIIVVLRHINGRRPPPRRRRSAAVRPRANSASDVMEWRPPGAGWE